MINAGSRVGEEQGEKPDWKQQKQESKELKLQRKITELGQETFNIRRDAKYIWEDLRRKDCPAQRKSELSTALFNLIKTSLAEVRTFNIKQNTMDTVKGQKYVTILFQCVLTHDMSRVIETLMATGTTEMREAVLNVYKYVPSINKCASNCRNTCHRPIWFC